MPFIFIITVASSQESCVFWDVATLWVISLLNMWIYALCHYQYCIFALFKLIGRNLPACSSGLKKTLIWAWLSHVNLWLAVCLSTSFLIKCCLDRFLFSNGIVAGREPPLVHLVCIPGAWFFLAVVIMMLIFSLIFD